MLFPLTHTAWCLIAMPYIVSSPGPLPRDHQDPAVPTCSPYTVSSDNITYVRICIHFQVHV